MIYYITTLSITLPDNVAKASNEVAKRLKISRTQFIRQAVIHELNSFQTRLEQGNIIKSLAAMKNSKKYNQDIEELTLDLNSDLPQERAEWWSKK